MWHPSGKFFHNPVREDGGRVINFSTSVVGTPELIDRVAKMAPLERLGTPEDAANAVAFLAGPDGGWINGQVLRANGGMI